MSKMQINSRTLAKRCEICHQSDLFDATKNYCLRCLSFQNINDKSQKIVNKRKYKDRSILTLFYIQIIVIIGLLVATPIIICFTPCIEPYTLNNIFEPFCIKATETMRKYFIYFGLIGGIICVISPILSNLISSQPAYKRVLQTSMALCGFVYGWKLFPYFVNGVFQAYIGKGDLGLFDPVHITPPEWFVGCWYIGAGLFQLFGPILIIYLFIVNYCSKRQVNDHNYRKMTYLFLFLVLLTYLVEPSYSIWLAD